MRFFATVLTLLLVLLQYKLWFGVEGVAQTMSIKHHVEQIRAVNQQSMQHNQDVANQINSLRNNREAIESLARENLGMVKKGESYYQFVGS